MHFANPEALYLCLLIPLVIAFYVILFKKKRQAIELFAKMPMFGRLAPAFSLRRQKVKALLLTLSLVFLIISLSGPQWGETETEFTGRGVDVFIALDCSQSMMAEDYKPNRLSLAKSILKSLVDKLQGNRIGVIDFAGAAYIECPLTVDSSAVKMYIDELDYNSIPVQGTSIGQAISLAVQSFNKKEKKDTEDSVLILLTDGEDLAGQALNAAKEAAKDKIRIYTLGIGSPEGTEIPLRDSEGKSVAPKTDGKGRIVKSRLDEDTLKEIAQLTGGSYLRCSYDEAGLNTISNEILGMEKKEYQRRLEKQYIHRYQYALALVLILLSIEFFIHETKKV